MIEDETVIADVIRRYLVAAGFGVRICGTGRDGLAAIRQDRPAAIVLDIGLPDMDGLDLCRQLRAAGDWTPVLFVTARDEDIDRILGLEMGGDDYLVKPFNPRELVARVRAVLRRSAGPGVGRRRSSGPGGCGSIPASAGSGWKARSPADDSRRRRPRRHCQDRHGGLYAPRDRTHRNGIRSVAVPGPAPRTGVRAVEPAQLGVGVHRRPPGRGRLTSTSPRCAPNSVTPARSEPSAASGTRRTTGDRIRRHPRRTAGARTSLAVRVTLLVVAVAVLVAVIASVVGVLVVRRTLIDVTTQALSDRADVIAAQVTADPAGAAGLACRPLPPCWPSRASRWSLSARRAS